MSAERLTEPALENVPRVPSRDAEGIAQVIDGAEKGWLWRQADRQCSHAGVSGTGPEVRAFLELWGLRLHPEANPTPLMGMLGTI